MNTSAAIEPLYSGELLEAAAQCFVRERLSRDGRSLVTSCVVIAVGFGASLALGADVPWLIGMGAAITAMGPLYIAYLYVAFPRQYAKRMARVLTPTARISLSQSAFEMSSQGRESRVPWTSIKEVWECPVAFLLVFSWPGMSFLVVPKNGLQPETCELLVGKLGAHAA